MTAIHVVTSGNRNRYENHIREFHRLRHQVFVEECGWEGIRRADGLDIDSYDNANAVYLLAVDGERLVGGQRLYPTILPHMISEVFPHLATRGIPRAPYIWEWTRYFVVKERRIGRTDCRLLAALQEFCLDEGISEVTAVVEMWWLPRWQQVGFKVRPLGLPVVVEGQACIAASIAVSETSLARVKRLAGFNGPSLIRHNLSNPVTDQVPYAAA